MNLRIAPTVIVIGVLITGCSGARSVAPSGAPPGVHNHVVQNGNVPINWTQFADYPQGVSPNSSVVVGADKNIWFGLSQGGLMQVTMAGKAKIFPLSYTCNGSSQCTFFAGLGGTVGSDKNFYFGSPSFDNNTGKYVIGVVTTHGVLTVHDIPSGDLAQYNGFALGSDGNVWFTENSHIGRITTTGTITEFAYPSGATSNEFGGVAAGPDGNIWFGESGNDIVGKINPTTLAITEFKLSSQGLSCGPTSITAASDGKLYFACNGSFIGQITTAGVAHVFYTPYAVSVYPNAMALGPGGNPWWATSNGAYLSEFDPTLVAFTTYVPPYTSGTTFQIAVGPDKNIWASENDGMTDVYIPSPLTVSPASLSFTATGQTQNLTVGETGTSSWKAASGNAHICSVAQGNKADIFVVTATGVGTTKITVKDAIGNSIAASCKVT